MSTCDNIQDDIMKMELIGQGTYGKIYLKKNSKYGSKDYALKVQELIDKSLDPYLISDVDISNKFKNSINIISTPVICIDEYNLYLSMEYMQTSLFNYIFNITKNEANRLKILRRNFEFVANSIANGLAQMHYFNITHNDIKPENILINIGKNFKITDVKITDFGLARGINNNIYRKTFEFATLPYRSPELLAEREYLTYHQIKSDVWSLGVTLVEMYKGKYLFSGCSKDEILKLIYDQSTYPTTFTNFVQDLKYGNLPKKTTFKINGVPYLLNKMFYIEPNERLNLVDLLTYTPYHIRLINIV